MAKLSALATLTTLCALTTPAVAQTYVATDARDSWATPPLYKQVDGRIGLLLGGADVGDADGFSAGVSGALGYRLGDITQRGMLDYYRVGDGDGVAKNRKELFTLLLSIKMRCGNDGSFQKQVRWWQREGILRI